MFINATTAKTMAEAAYICKQADETLAAVDTVVKPYVHVMVVGNEEGPMFTVADSDGLEDPEVIVFSEEARAIIEDLVGQIFKVARGH